MNHKSYKSLMMRDKPETILRGNTDLMRQRHSETGAGIACRVALAGGLKSDISAHVYSYIN